MNSKERDEKTGKKEKEKDGKDETEHLSEDMSESCKKKLAKKDEELAKLKQDIESWKNQYYQAYADMANLRKEIEKDHKEVKKYRIEGFVEELVRTLDAFDLALKAETKNIETKNYLIGFTYVYNQLIETLTKEGIKVIDPKVGDKFDEKVMHCVDTVNDVGEDNTIKEVSAKGYKLHDHLIRAAMVVVTKHDPNKTSSPEESTTDEPIKTKETDSNQTPDTKSKSNSKRKSTKKSNSNKKTNSETSTTNEK